MEITQALTRQRTPPPVLSRIPEYEIKKAVMTGKPPQEKAPAKHKKTFRVTATTFDGRTVRHIIKSMDMERAEERMRNAHPNLNITGISCVVLSRKTKK